MTVYQILTRLFGKGRFSSFSAKEFEYFKSLSITHLWFTGVIRQSTGKPYVKGDIGSPYSIADYYDVNDFLADEPENRMKEFGNLVNRCHKHGFKVVLDYIPNHVSPDYSDAFGGFKTCGYHDYDWTDTDKIDYSCSENWEKMLNVILFWAAKGVDAFRCDMVELVPVDYWAWLIPAAKAKYPNLEFIAEVYDFNSYGRFKNEAKFDYLYDKSGLYDRIRAIYSGYGSTSELTANWQRLGELQPAMLNFLENHDEQRLASPYFAGSAQRGFAALAMSALFYPAPFMFYFGQELGEDAHDGAEGRTSIFSWVRPIKPTSRLSAEQKDVLEVYRRVLGLKEKLGDASNFDLCYAQSASQGFDFNRHFAFLRRSDKMEVLVVCNFSDSPADITINIPEEAGSAFASGIKISVPAKDFFLLITS